MNLLLPGVAQLEAPSPSQELAWPIRAPCLAIAIPDQEPLEQAVVF